MERKLIVDYVIRSRSRHGERSGLSLWHFRSGEVVVSWCESRQAFRHFRADRTARLVLSDVRYLQRREVLLRKWRETESMTLR